MDGLERIADILEENEPLTWLTALGMAALFLAVVAFARWVIVQRVSRFTAKTSSRLDDGLVEVVRGTKLWLMFFIALVFGAQSLALPEKVAAALQAAATVAFFLQLGIWLGRLLKYYLGDMQQRAMQTNPASATSLGALIFAGQIIVWSIVLLMMLDNLGINVTAMVAGLGVGGIAVALAVQNILGDLFASLSIVIDKPFVLGDFIIVDDYMGSVEHIGLKTTRIRSLGGEQIVFSNSDLLGARVRNYKRMFERRVVFGFGVTYSTTADQMEKITAKVTEIVKGTEGVRFDRAHFAKFGDSSLDFEVVYWMLDPDFNKYMDTQQAINLKIMRCLAEMGLSIAFPSRSLYFENALKLEGGSSRATPEPVRAPRSRSRA